MPRNLIICCDGTNNKFGPENTNVVRLVQSLERDPEKQHIYYDPGVGTLPEPGAWTWLQKKISKWYGLAIGAGLAWKVQEAYSFLMDYWEPGDKVFMFGFSRGAYTVRVLAGLLHLLGLMPHGNYNLVPYAWLLYASRGGSDAIPASYWQLCGEFRQTFARRTTVEDHDRHFRVHFLGLWDTVSSVGWAWDPKKNLFTAENPSIDIILHAVSVDERRRFFRQNLMSKKDGETEQDLLEFWFPGVHCDVGGGYPEKDGGLWQGPFEWILNEAQKANLRVNKDRLDNIMGNTSARPWLSKQHESLTPLWRVAEYYPKYSAKKGTFWRELLKALCRFFILWKGTPRYIHDGALIHKSTLLRIREKTDYRPQSFSTEFIEKVQRLTEIPEAFPYEP